MAHSGHIHPHQPQLQEAALAAVSVGQPIQPSNFHNNKDIKFDGGPSESSVEGDIRTNSEEVDAIFSSGISLQENEEIEHACLNLKKVTQLDPNHHGAHFNLGYIYYEKTNLPMALKYLERAAKLDDQDLETWLTLGLVYRDNGSLQESLDAFRKALKIDPNNEMGYYNLGLVYYDLIHCNIRDATECFEKIIQLSKDSPETLLKLGMGLSYQSKRMNQKALECLEKAGNLEPSLGKTAAESLSPMAKTAKNCFCAY